MIGKVFAKKPIYEHPRPHKIRVDFSLFLVVLNNTSGASFSFLSRVTEIGVIRMNSKGL
jgi:hypothetical protein